LRDADPDLRGTGREIPLLHAHPMRVEYIKFGRHGRLDQMYQACDVDLNDYFKFSFVRHPYTRFQSAYSYFNNITDTAKNAGFSNYQQMMDWIEDTKAVKLHVKPQSYWHDQRINQYFKFEEVEKLSLEKFISGLNYNKRSAKIRKSDHPELDPTLKQRIYNFYKQDFDLFFYKP
jgi:hypothetical protein